MKRYVLLARRLDALSRCDVGGEWYHRHNDIIDAILESAPSGGGFDNGASLNRGGSGSEHLRFDVSFHHMDEYGHYDGWTEHEVHVRPSLGFEIEVRAYGPNRNAILDFIEEVFYNWLMEEIDATSIS